MMRLEELINEHYDNLNDNDMHVLKYILNNRETCYNMGINELADACHASRSSILRMTQKLNFTGYSEFRVLLKWENQSKDFDDNHNSTFQNDITTTLKNLEAKDFEPVNELLYSARRIFIYGTGTAQLKCAEEAQRLFAIIHRFITIIHDKVEFDMILPGIQDDDAVIIMSLSGDTPSLIPQVKQLVAKGITFVSITNLKNNKLAQLSPHNIYATSTETTTRNGMELVSFVPFHLTIDMMFRKYVEYLDREGQ